MDAEICLVLNEEIWIALSDIGMKSEDMQGIVLVINFHMHRHVFGLDMYSA